jgi:hypothetical protein
MGVRLLPPGRRLRFHLAAAFLNLDPRLVYASGVLFLFVDYGLHARFRYAAQAVNIFHGGMPIWLQMITMVRPGARISFR